MQRSILNTSGIYKIRNMVNGKFYIGSSKQIRKRWKGHRNSLRKNKHCNPHLQSAVNHYGLDNFVCEIVEKVPQTNDDLFYKRLIEKEQYWLDTLKSCDRKIGYNVLPNAGTPLGRKYSQESIERMRQSHIGHRHTKESKMKISESQYKPVYQIDTNGKIVRQFGSCIEAEKKTGISRQNISMACRKKTNYVGGFQWCYVSNFENFVHHLPKGCKPVFRIENGKQKQIWNSIQDAAKSVGVSYITMQRWLKKETEYHYV